jgi:hypothetical protein
MSGTINILSKIIIAKDLISKQPFICLNSAILTTNNDLSFIDLSNTIFLKLKDQSKNNIFGLTQSNLVNNMLITRNKTPDTTYSKIIFMKKDKKKLIDICCNDTSNIYLQEILNNMRDNHFLFDTYESSKITNETSNFLQFNVQLDISKNTNNYVSNLDISNNFKLDIADLYLNLIENYKTFFNKNYLDNSVLDFTVKDFNYLLKEFQSNVKFNLYTPSLGNLWKPYENKPITNSNIIIDNIYDNAININIHTGLDLSNHIIKNNIQNLNYINEINNNNIKTNSFTNLKNIDNRYLFFNEYIIFR